MQAQDSILKPFSLSVDIEHRLINIYDCYTVDDYNIGRTTLGLSLTANIHKGYYLGFMQSVKYAPYGYFYKVGASTIFEKHKLLLDYKFFVGKRFRFNKDKALDVHAGIGKMDIGGYFYVMDTHRNVLKIDIQHIGYHIEAGYEYKGFSIGAGYYHIPHFYKGFIVSGCNKAGILYIHTGFNFLKF